MPPPRVPSSVRKLRYFRVSLSPGGHFDTGDRLELLLDHRTIDALREDLAALGVSTAVESPDAGSGFGLLGGMRVYWSTRPDGGVWLSVVEGATDAYSVNEAMVEAAKRLEAILAPLESRMILHRGR